MKLSLDIQSVYILTGAQFEENPDIDGLVQSLCQYISKFMSDNKDLLNNSQTYHLTEYVFELQEIKPIATKFTLDLVHHRYTNILNRVGITVLVGEEHKLFLQNIINSK